MVNVKMVRTIMCLLTILLTVVLSMVQFAGEGCCSNVTFDLLSTYFQSMKT